MSILNKALLLILGMILTSAMVLSLFGCNIVFNPECSHEWNNATCTEAKTCKKCGESDGVALGHNWLDATCTSAKTCSVCNETDGEPNGHVGSGENCLSTIECEVCGEDFVAYESHTWIDATCTTAKTCSVCNETDGEPNGHNYTAYAMGDGTHKLVCSTDPTHEEIQNCYGGEATCLTSATCEACNELYGEIGNHAWLDATCTEPETCKWCNLPDGEPKGHDYDYSTGKCVDCDDTVSIILYTLTPTQVIESINQTIIFYAEIKIDATINSVRLYDSLGNIRATMYDDGNYSVTKDEFSNDGVYTCSVSINTSTETDISFYVVINDNTDAKSNVQSIKWVEQMTTEEFENMEDVEEQLEEVVTSTDFGELTEDEKTVIIEETITSLESSSLIADNSVVYNSTNGIFTFVYESGVLGAIAITEWVDDEAVDSNFINSFAMNQSLGVDAVILWSFDQYSDIPWFREPFYNDLYNNWTNKGINTTLDKEVTVEDYKNLSSYEIILISSHGAFYEYRVGRERTATIPGIILSETATRAKDELYANDLKMQRIAKYTCLGGTKYVILPAFWEYYYGNGALDGSFVVSESCEFYGAYGNVNLSMANAILDCSAESVVGFHNSVKATYSRNFASAYINNLASGMTSKEAYNLAKEDVGENDGQWFNAAYPIFAGYESYLISSTLENGSFEESPNLTGWSVEGDVRILSKLGDLNPTDENKMAILTTGVGSGTSGYLEATEGSVLYQSFLINNANSTLSFDYNVVSEEPMEYVGSRYDDKMYVEIIDEAGTKIIICSESVNTSTWYSISGINFEGGDDSCYETGWKTMTVDLSQYDGQFITIRFVVYDVGDSIYDTAALIDNVKVN